VRQDDTGRDQPCAPDVRNANRHVHAQIQRIGLAAFVAAPPAPAPAAGQQEGRKAGPEMEVGAASLEHPSQSPQLAQRTA